MSALRPNLPYPLAHIKTYSTWTWNILIFYERYKWEGWGSWGVQSQIYMIEEDTLPALEDLWIVEDWIHRVAEMCNWQQQKEEIVYVIYCKYNFALKISVSAKVGVVWIFVMGFFRGQAFLDHSNWLNIDDDDDWWVARFLPSIGLTIIELEIIQKCLRSNKVPICVISSAALVSNEMQNTTIAPSSIAMLGWLSWVQQVNDWLVWQCDSLSQIITAQYHIIPTVILDCDVLCCLHQ